LCVLKYFERRGKYDGIYLANASSKSVNYCAAEVSNNIGAMLVCEAALGTPSQRKNADYYINKKTLEKEKCHSTHGLGQSAPSGHIKIGDIIMPNGKLKKTTHGASLLYDEFIVYDQRQLMQKYLILFKKK
jgi:poly [ADP-ribose] polymerase